MAHDFFPFVVSFDSGPRFWFMSELCSDVFRGGVSELCSDVFRGGIGSKNFACHGGWRNDTRSMLRREHCGSVSAEALSSSKRQFSGCFRIQVVRFHDLQMLGVLIMFARPLSKQNILTPSLWSSKGSVIQKVLARGPSREHKLITALKVSLSSKSGLAVVPWNGTPCAKSSRSKASSSTWSAGCPRWWRWSGGDSKVTFELEDLFAPVPGLSALGGGRTGGAFTGGQVFLTAVLTGLLVSRFLEKDSDLELRRRRRGGGGKFRGRRGKGLRERLVDFELERLLDLDLSIYGVWAMLCTPWVWAMLWPCGKMLPISCKHLS